MNYFQKNKGILLLVGSTVFFAVMSSLVRTIQDVGGLHTVFFRFMISLSTMSILAMLKVFPLKFNRSPLLLLRGFTGGIATFLFYLSIQKLGVGKGTLIVYSYPIFASIFSAIFLKEQISKLKWAIIAVAFSGFYLLGSNQANLFGAFGKYELIAIAGSMLSATSIVLVKKLHDSDSSYAIFFSQAIMGFWLFVGPASTAPVDLNTTQFVILLAIGLTAVGAQLLMTTAYKHVSVSTGASFYLTVPVINLFLGRIFFHETLTLREVIGAIIVLLACFALSRVKK